MVFFRGGLGLALPLAREDSSFAPRFSPHPGTQGSPCQAQRAWLLALGPRVRRGLPWPDSQTTPLREPLPALGKLLSWGWGCRGGLWGNLRGWSFRLLPAISLAQPPLPHTQPRALAATCAHPRGSCPTRGFEDLGLGLLSRRA